MGNIRLNCECHSADRNLDVRRNRMPSRHLQNTSKTRVRYMVVLFKSEAQLVSHVFLGCLQDRCLESLNDDPSTSSIVAIASFSDGFSALVGRILIFLVALLWDQCCTSGGDVEVECLGWLGLAFDWVSLALAWTWGTCGFFQIRYLFVSASVFQGPGDLRRRGSAQHNVFFVRLFRICAGLQPSGWSP